MARSRALVYRRCQMKITRAIIHNFRNLKDVDVRLDNLIALVGENNSGRDPGRFSGPRPPACSRSPGPSCTPPSSSSRATSSASR
ncbi:AAA family ATPase, partial [Atopobiaceae bacterium HCP3S3_F7]